MSSLEKRKNEICGHLLVKSSRLFFTHSVQDITTRYNLDINEHHFRVFPYIESQGTTISQIAQAMKISKQAVSKLVNKLVDDGILHFSKSTDGRQKLIKYRKGPTSPVANSLNYLKEQDRVLEKILGGKKDLDTLKKYLLLIQKHYTNEDLYG